MTNSFDAETSSSVSPLFAPLSVRSLTVANRFVMAPMTRGGSPLGVPGENVASYYRRRAEGGVGLIITEGTAIDHPASVGYADYNGHDIPLLFGDAAMAGWRAVVDAVHAVGGKIAPQLWHQGVMRLDGTAPFPDHPSSRPSGLWGPDGGRSTIDRPSVEKLLPPTKALSESEIADIVAGYARSSALAREAGFDAIAIHGAHGYLIDSFLWAETNRRSDRYGGDIVARTRFAVEVIRAVRASIGPDCPIILRFSQWKQQDFEAKLVQSSAELERMLVPLAEAGVDIFDASTRNLDIPAFEDSRMNLAGWTRKLTGKTTMAVGGVGMDRDLFTSYATGLGAPASLGPVLERFEREEFDLVGVGRALIADPQWVEKIRSGAVQTAFEPAMLASIV